MTVGAISEIFHSAYEQRYGHAHREAPIEIVRGIEVQVHREGAVVLARSGYFADPPRTQSKTKRSKDVPVQVRRLPQPSAQPESGSSESARPEKDSRRPPDGQPRPPIVRPQP